VGEKYKKCNIHKTIVYSATLHNRYDLKCEVVCYYFDIVHYGPGVDSASNRNEYQVYFLGAKAAGA